jgi:DNA adenine methylase
LSRPIYAFWHSLLNKPLQLIARIRKTPVTIEQWRLQKDIFANAEHHSLLDLGFATFFLNRTNRSGILRGGVIGGNRQRGKWGIDARYDKEALVVRIERIARYANRITLYNSDAAELMRSLVPELPSRTLIYADPPYFSQGRRLYDTHYLPKDHEEVARLMRSNDRQPWVVSYDDQPEIRSLFSGLRRVAYNLRYTAAESHQGSELIFLSNSLTVAPTAISLLGEGAVMRRTRGRTVATAE